MMEEKTTFDSIYFSNHGIIKSIIRERKNRMVVNNVLSHYPGLEHTYELLFP